MRCVVRIDMSITIIEELLKDFTSAVAWLGEGMAGLCSRWVHLNAGTSGIDTITYGQHNKTTYRLLPVKELTTITVE